MVPVFRYGSATQSTAPSESTFKVIKADYFKHLELPLRCDDFVQHHITQLTGASHLVEADYKLQEKRIEAVEDIENIENIEFAEENWMGVQTEHPKRRLLKMKSVKTTYRRTLL